LPEDKVEVEVEVKEGMKGGRDEDFISQSPHLFISPRI